MKLNLLKVIKYRNQGFTSQKIADKFGVSISLYEKFVTKNKHKIPKPVKFKDYKINIEKWKEANHNLDLLDIGLPGTLPVINRQAVNQAIKTGLALNAKVNNRSIFRKRNVTFIPIRTIQNHFINRIR